MSKKNRLHLDSNKESGGTFRIRSSLCGIVGVSTTIDASLATCKMCLARLRGKARKPDASAKMLDAAALASELHIELGLGSAPLAPRASAPPRFTPELWASTCRTGERCRDCQLCAWQDEVERWEYASAWTREHAPKKPENAPRWNSLASAIVALLEYEQAGRDLRSSVGPQLRRIEFGSTVETNPRATSRQIRVAEDVVMVRMALERAYAGDHWRLSQADCIRVLIERTPRVLPELVPYPALVARYGLTQGDLQSIVRRGRRAVEEDLATRGLIPPPRVRPRGTASASTWSAPDVL